MTNGGVSRHWLYIKEIMDKEKIEQNKAEFLNLIDSIGRLSKEDVEYIKSYIVNTDFFFAPASARYKGSYPGGLCEHSLNVYYNLVRLYETFAFDIDGGDFDSLKIVALFHDIGKIRTFRQEMKSKKVYDSNGNSKWVEYIGYSIDDSESVGTEEENSAYIASTIIPMTKYEYTAILNHKGFFNGDSSVAKTIEKFKSNKLAEYLFFANQMDMFNE